ncbi:hypothetical protein OHS70_20600 [Streptomyces sp. NBC_00390]|uniref:hypothetical protein n=1 Tax=Streptomyces sp. NBC_00390 TaxID=2975736 RepID=UPI002E2477D2
MLIDKALTGLARNPALPEHLLRRLLDHQEACGEAARRRTDLTEELTDGILAFGDDWRALSLACNPELPPAVRRTLAGHADDMVRSALASRAPGLSGDVFAALAEDPSAKVRTDVARNGDTPPAIRARLADDPDPAVRIELAQWWVEAPEDVRRTLLTDEDPKVRAAACSTYFRRTPHPVPPADLHAALLADPVTRAGAVRHVVLDEALAKELAEDPDDDVRAAFAAHPDLPAGLRDALAQDASPLVRAEIFVREDTPEEHRASIHQELTDGADRGDAAFAVTEEDLLCQLALTGLTFRDIPWIRADPLPHVDSPYACFRRSAAAGRDLPAEAVDRLLEDEDNSVRHTMAAHAPALSPEAAERVERRHQRSKVRGRPADHTTFPPETLRRFATDADPRIRALAPRDPDLPAALAARLAADDDHLVRREVAPHPNLPVAALRALLADGDEEESVVTAAASSPALPVEAMEELLAQAGL